MLGQEKIKLKQNPESPQKKTMQQGQQSAAPVELTTLEAFKLMQRKIQEKGVEQHQDFINQVVDTQKILEEQ